MDSRDKSSLSILFLGKKDDAYCNQALEYCQEKSDRVKSYLGEWGQPFPVAASEWEGDVVISYLSRWIVPEKLLSTANVAAINFHPATPEYPGIGCINFALYDGVGKYGATCHHMAPRVDTGGIISVMRFPVELEDSVASLLDKTYKAQYELFTEIADIIFSGKELPLSDEEWARAPYTREEFNDLMVISPNMDAEEIARRVRATSFGQWQPVVNLGGYTFKLVPDEPVIS